MIDTLESDEIRRLYNKQWYPEALYLLAMVDYLHVKMACLYVQNIAIFVTVN